MTEFVSAASATTAGASTLTVSSVNVAAGNLLVATVATGSGQTASGVTHDGNALTKLGETDNAGLGEVSIWFIEGASTTADVVVTFSASTPGSLGASVWSSAGTPDNYSEQNEDSASSPVSIDVSAAGADDFIADVARINDNAATVGADQTEIFNDNQAGSEYLSSRQDGDVDSVMTWSWLPGTADVAFAACRIPNAVAGANPKGPLGHPLRGALAGPVI